MLDRCFTNTWGLGSLQNTENEANSLLPFGIQKLKGFQLRWGGASPPDPLTRLRPRPPSRSPCVSTLHFFDLATPLEYDLRIMSSNMTGKIVYDLGEKPSATYNSAVTWFPYVVTAVPGFQQRHRGRVYKVWYR